MVSEDDDTDNDGIADAWEIDNFGDLTSADGEASGSDRFAHSIFFRCMEKGVILNYPSYGTTLGLSFPLNIEQEHVDLAISVLDEALGEES